VSLLSIDTLEELRLNHWVAQLSFLFNGSKTPANL